MINQVKRIIVPAILMVLVFIVFFNISYIRANVSTKGSNLVVYGDNLKPAYKPFVENDGIYLSVDTISKSIDEDIYYDKIATKVIITTYTDVIKFKIDESKMSKNLEYIDISTPAKLIDGQPYIDINLVKDIYGIKLEYNKDTNTISIDSLETSDISIKYNNVNVYSELSTKSNVLQTLKKDSKVTVYLDSLKHNRWYKIKTDTGVIGYISNNNIAIADINIPAPNPMDGSSSSIYNNQKIVMFWQYGSDLSVLGNQKIDGVNTVSPTWYELKSSSGEISSKYNKNYYNQAKNLGYNVWPIITNGIDSTSYSPSDTSAMLNSEYNREKFIINLINIVKNDKLDGINIDFEAMKTEDRDVYTQFIRELAPMLRKESVKVSVDTYFVSYIDRKGIGKAADYVALMGYDQRGAWSTESGSIASISWVEKNVESLINDSKIPSYKIILGVPFYTRLWKEKVGDAKPTTNVYTMKDCQEFIKEYGITPVWDEDAGQNYAEYNKGDITYKLWIEDAASIKKRVETVNKYKLAGISGWRKGYETNDIWNVVKDNLK